VTASSNEPARTNAPTRDALLHEADRIVAGLSPGRRESVREIVINAEKLGQLSAGGRAYLIRVTGTPFVADLLEAVLAEPGHRRGPLSEV
jgi:hypothetical protein